MKKYTVQEVADLLGIYRGTVINYEKRGVFPSPKRNPINGYREYTEEEIELLRKILAGELPHCSQKSVS
ncbi:MAG: MerR family transcriptional regulator [Candidatus Omnitrophica bacterium]|nr:MerR family transcriptional regulator [Candidatus Omnitrophota bacterium]